MKSVSSMQVKFSSHLAFTWICLLILLIFIYWIIQKLLSINSSRVQKETTSEFQQQFKSIFQYLIVIIMFLFYHVKKPCRILFCVIHHRFHSTVCSLMSSDKCDYPCEFIDTANRWRKEAIPELTMISLYTCAIALTLMDLWQKQSVRIVTVSGQSPSSTRVLSLK